jgi:hypothetical protein
MENVVNNQVGHRFALLSYKLERIEVGDLETVTETETNPVRVTMETN